MRKELLDKLERCLERAGATAIKSVDEMFTFSPADNPRAALLGTGSFGEVYRMSPDKSTQLSCDRCVVKLIRKVRLIRDVSDIQHLATELVVSSLLQHSRLNRRIGLFHTRDLIVIPMELCETPLSSVEERALFIIASYAPMSLPHFDKLIASWHNQHKLASEVSFDEFVQSRDLINRLARECGVNKEPTQNNDLFGHICSFHRIPEPLARIITRQALEGLQYMHDNLVIHRDIKTENIVVAIERRCYPIRNKKTGLVIGARITETVSSNLIDFGLVKCLRPNFSAAFQTPKGDIAPTTTSIFHNSASLEDIQDINVGNEFPVTVTACGTEVYCALEVLDGILSTAQGRGMWLSSLSELPKVDIYGIGTVLYCMVHGYPPFRHRQNVAYLTAQERVHQVKRLVAAGPIISSRIHPETRTFIEKLMSNDPTKRPIASEALRDDYFRNVKEDSHTYMIYGDGRAPEFIQPSPPEIKPDEEQREEWVRKSDEHENDVLAAIREKEDR